MILENVDLCVYHTLSLKQKARYLVEVSGQAELEQALRFAKQKKIDIKWLGDGSNVVFARDYEGLLIINRIKGLDWKPGDQSIQVRAGSGENWHGFVMAALEREAYGLENLVLIPGTVGAAPVQNIGAYGVEVAHFIKSVEAWDCVNRKIVTLDREQCCFAYRFSIFKKQNYADRYIITHVNFRLSATPAINITYKPLKEYFLSTANPQPSPQAVAERVISIRQSKLPDPALLANAGSFFKNPVVSKKKFAEIRRKYPDVVHYPQANGEIKLAAAWMIDQAGWKGHQHGRVGVHTDQALVLVNYGDATGAELLALAGEIEKDINHRFGVKLEIEPDVIG